MWFKRFLLALLMIGALILSLTLPAPEASLEELLLCPVCFGQSIFESNHPVALEIKETIGLWQQEGLSASAIITRLEQSHGSHILELEVPLARFFLYATLCIVGLSYAYKKRR